MRFQQTSRAGDGQGRRGHRVLPLVPARRARRGRWRPGPFGSTAGRVPRAGPRPAARDLAGGDDDAVHPRHQAQRGRARPARRAQRDRRPSGRTRSRLAGASLDRRAAPSTDRTGVAALADAGRRVAARRRPPHGVPASRPPARPSCARRGPSPTRRTRTASRAFVERRARRRRRARRGRAQLVERLAPGVRRRTSLGQRAVQLFAARGPDIYQGCERVASGSSTRTTARARLGRARGARRALAASPDPCADLRRAKAAAHRARACGCGATARSSSAPAAYQPLVRRPAPPPTTSSASPRRGEVAVVVDPACRSARGAAGGWRRHRGRAPGRAAGTTCSTGRVARASVPRRRSPSTCCDGRSPVARARVGGLTSRLRGLGAQGAHGVEVELERRRERVARCRRPEPPRLVRRRASPARRTARDYRLVLDGGEPLPDPRAPLAARRRARPGAAWDPAAFAWSRRRLARPGRSATPAWSTSCTSARSRPAGTLDAAARAARPPRRPRRQPRRADAARRLRRARAGGATTASRSTRSTTPYGGPDALCRFVDAAHARGLACCSTWCTTTSGPSGNHWDGSGRSSPTRTDAVGRRGQPRRRRAPTTSARSCSRQRAGLAARLPPRRAAPRRRARRCTTTARAPTSRSWPTRCRARPTSSAARWRWSPSPTATTRAP